MFLTNTSVFYLFVLFLLRVNYIHHDIHSMGTCIIWLLKICGMVKNQSPPNAYLIILVLILTIWKRCCGAYYKSKLNENGNSKKQEHLHAVKT